MVTEVFMPGDRIEHSNIVSQQELCLVIMGMVAQIGGEEHSI
jgi:hypothetical protein